MLESALGLRVGDRAEERSQERGSKRAFDERPTSSIELEVENWRSHALQGLVMISACQPPKMQVTS